MRTLTLRVSTSFVLCAMAQPGFSWQGQETSVPPNVSAYLPKQAVVRASVQLGKSVPEKWFVAYDQNEEARVALIEGNMLTDDKAFESKHALGHKLSLQNVKSISVPNAETAFLLSLEQEGNHDAKYFSVLTFASGALDIKLFVSTLSGRAEVLDNPFRVRIWDKIREAGPTSKQYKVSEYRLPNVYATKLVKVQEETKTSE